MPPVESLKKQVGVQQRQQLVARGNPMSTVVDKNLGGSAAAVEGRPVTCLSHSGLAL